MARKILLADDSVTAQNMGRKILADAGYEVITVNNGSAALKKIAEQHPDVIVLDVYMPGYSGLEVCQRLKEVSETSHIPILLTVGKLEPFKPEEVRRVRADAFIVKPFEASELLSALSKLEDRIVPRAESSKPGRFARATAAIDDGRFDKTVAIEEDSGWKNRIRFPEKKKEKQKEAQPEPDEAAVYSAGSKDLRTAIEHKIAEAPKNGKQEERVDVGALAPAGLPKDVTPEEIAALAAAAAQMQGKIAGSKIAESMPATPAGESSKPEGEGSKLESREERAEPKPELSIPAATVAEPKTNQEVEAKSAEPAAASISLPESQSSRAEAPDEPVTMAVGSSSPEMLPAPSRWTAVSVALAPEDGAISLEQEMQRAYAAFAAAETGHAGNTSTSDLGSASTTLAEMPSEAVLSVPASAAPPEAQPLSAVASAAADAVGAAAEHLQQVAASYVEQKEATSTAATEPPSPAVELVPEPKIESVASQPEIVAADNPKIETQPQTVSNEFRVEESRDSALPAEHSAQAEVSTRPAESNPAPAAEVSSTPQTPFAESLQHETDMAANTAAAWANWRGSVASPAEPAAQEIAAKAVAAGAESTPEDVTIDIASDPAIASIVDSVLADLRPKIVEEISRKFGKKK